MFDTNPLLQPFDLPPFDKIKPEHFAPALDAALETHQKAIAAIVDNPEPATFENTLVALELAHQPFNRTVALFHHYAAHCSSDAIQALETELAPRLSHHDTSIMHFPGLFERLQTVTATGAEEERLLEKTLLAFTRAGAALAPDDKTTLAETNARLASLITAFDQTLMNEIDSTAVFLTEAEIDGVPPVLKTSAKARAESLGKPESFAIGIDRSSAEAFLQASPRRDVRERVFTRWTQRGSTEDYDTSDTLREIVTLRRQKAHLLGYASYPDFALAPTMAKTSAEVHNLLTTLWSPARTKFLAEKEELQHFQNEPIQPWDWDYYAEKVRQKNYALDDAALAPYLSLDRMINAAFATAHKLFGVTMQPRLNAPIWHEDVRVWDVQNRDGQKIGTFYGDYFARSGKRGGAWMSELATQHHLGAGQLPIITNTCNFTKPAAGHPALLSWDEAKTLFHEFGHGLHGLLSNVTYPSLAGVTGSMDYVELPSQLFEHWLGTPEILRSYARHVETNAPMPNTLIEKIKQAETFNQGYMTLSYLASALVDYELYQHPAPETLTPKTFEREVMEKYDLPEGIVPRHRLSHFAHSMSDLYAAHYSCYIWASVLDCDAFSAFHEAKNAFDTATAQRLLAEIYSTGNTKDPMERFIAFRGRAPTRDALLADRGLV